MRTVEHSRATNTIKPQAGDKSTFVILHEFPSPDLEKAWRDLLSRVEVPAHYDSPEFFVEPKWIGKQHFAILALNRDSVMGVMTGRHMGNEAMSGLQSRPQLCVDMKVDTTATLASLARGLLTEAGSAKLVTVYNWSSMPLDAFESYGFRRRDLEGDVVLDLTKGPEVLFRELHASRRKNIRQAIKNGVEVFQAKTPEDVETLYQIHLRWQQTTRKKIWTPQIPREAFEQRFYHRDNIRFILARYSGKIIAGITLRFCPRGLIEFSEHSSLDEFLHLKPNDLLQWKVIEWACNEGFRRCSLGGAHTFHRRFGGTVVPIIRYRMDRTWFHQYDLQEAAMDRARLHFRRLPHRVQKVVRRILNKPEQVP
ncbi:MAG TPA: GNAT family N-acetyltransferase [Candidatus Acidoferrales bacterium]|nr:GNAT family N-acetyltransferase [Candidatus Acidoferrales bacterium]